jgi:ssDNA-binding replication factor A large subunit
MWRVRRIVTATDQDGKSYLHSEEIVSTYKEMYGMEGLYLTDLWETKGPRADNRGTEDAALRPVHLGPPDGSTILRIVEFPLTRTGAARGTYQPAL